MVGASGAVFSVDMRGARGRGRTVTTRASARRGEKTRARASGVERRRRGEDASRETGRRDLLAGGLGVGASVWLPGSAEARVDASRANARAVPTTETPLRGTRLTPSRVIKGCWQLSGGHGGDRDSDRTKGDAAVEDFERFVDAGVTTFDTGPEACGYGPSELIIGEYLKSPAGRRRANEVKVFTKLCCVGREQYGMTKEWVEANVDRPRKRLGVDKLNMVQMYWNDYGSKGYVDAALYLTDLKHKGKIDAVSLTNFDTQRMREMVDAGAEISTNQIQYSLLDRRPEKYMTKYCKDTGIGLLPYGVVAGGLLADKYLDAPKGEFRINTSSLRKYSSVLAEVGGFEWYQSLLRTLRAVGDKHGGASISNVASKWVLDSPVVPAIIIGARNASHIDDHRALFDFDLDDSDRRDIESVLEKGYQAKEDAYTWERGGRW